MGISIVAQAVTDAGLPDVAWSGLMPLMIMAGGAIVLITVLSAMKDSAPEWFWLGQSCACRKFPETMSSNRPVGGVCWLMTVDDETFYRKHAVDLSRLATVMVGPGDGHDVFTEAMLRVFRAPRWAELSDLDKRRYAYRAVVNEARSWARSVRRRHRRETVWSLHRESVVSSDLHPEVWDAVASLSPRQRAVVYLTYWADLDGISVASALGISEGSVRQHLDRARRTLRRRIDG